LLLLPNEALALIAEKVLEDKCLDNDDPSPNTVVTLLDDKISASFLDSLYAPLLESSSSPFRLGS
jgi:hypothetical protein